MGGGGGKRLRKKERQQERKRERVHRGAKGRQHAGKTHCKYVHARCIATICIYAVKAGSLCLFCARLVPRMDNPSQWISHHMRTDSHQHQRETNRDANPLTTPTANCIATPAKHAQCCGWHRGAKRLHQLLQQRFASQALCGYEYRRLDEIACHIFGLLMVC